MGERLYIVDYDIPVEPVRRKVQFYRDLNQVLGKCGTPPEYSTRSVFRTPHMMLAEALFMLVLAHGEFRSCVLWGRDYRELYARLYLL
jgi:hypothetical protein